MINFEGKTLAEHECMKAAELGELKEAVIRLTVIQEIQTKQLITLELQAVENTKFKSKVGGVVIATMIGVSAVWALVLGLFQIFKVVKS